MNLSTTGGPYVLFHPLFVHWIQYSLRQKKVYTFVEPSTQNWEGPDEK